MILIGSQAARLRGDQPDWTYETADFDLIGSDTEYEALKAYFQAGPDPFVAHDLNEAGRKAIRVFKPNGERILIDFLTDQRPSSQALMKLPHAFETEVFGQPCQVVTALTELVSKMAYEHTGNHAAKNRKLKKHWRSKCGKIQWTPELKAFRDTLRAEYNERLGLA